MTQAALGDNCPTCVWNGNTIRIIPGTVVSRKDLTVGGFSTDDDLKFSVNVSDLPQNGQPTLRQTITYLNADYRLDAIITMPGGMMLEYQLNSVSGGV